MKIRIVVVEWEVPPSVKRWALRVGIPVVALGLSAIAYASGPKTWTPGESLKSVDLNTNFAIVRTPPGAISAFGGGAAPDGWLLCDGSAVSRTMYADLFSAIGTTFGAGDGATTFNTPDLRGRAVVGAGSGQGLSARKVGDSFGAESVSLTTAQLPAHTHAVNDPGHSHTSAGGFGFVSPGPGQSAGIVTSGNGYVLAPHTSPSTTNITVQSTGNGAPVPVVPPGLALNAIIKT
jgi:microcystin-dependent protein